MLITSSSSASGGGLSVASTESVEVPIVSNINTSVAAAKTGVLTTRTDANTGSLTMDTGHGITTGQRLDLYWTISSVNYQRRGLTVGTVATNAVPIDGGSGDVLPSTSQAITAMVPELFTMPSNITEANVKCFGASITNTTSACVVSLGGGSYTEQTAFTLNDATWDSSIEWSDTYTGTSPISPGTTISQVYVSHGDSNNAANFTMKLGT